mmetsp:Transcript_6740/g.16346  ORF Transcript_6740/g.16346 Transcript_6740/m.16346 type:complete len:223 (+) Transcript_6740:525-1193(+)
MTCITTSISGSVGQSEEMPHDGKRTTALHSSRPPSCCASRGPAREGKRVALRFSCMERCVIEGRREISLAFSPVSSHAFFSPASSRRLMLSCWGRTLSDRGVEAQSSPIYLMRCRKYSSSPRNQTTTCSRKGRPRISEAPPSRGALHNDPDRAHLACFEIVVFSLLFVWCGLHFWSDSAPLYCRSKSGCLTEETSSKHTMASSQTKCMLPFQPSLPLQNSHI